MRGKHEPIINFIGAFARRHDADRGLRHGRQHDVRKQYA
nr:MAG TPA: hypothetical protein [Caudoviricetes sp.]